jgi:hypothetical protein
MNPYLLGGECLDPTAYSDLPLGSTRESIYGAIEVAQNRVSVAVRDTGRESAARILCNWGISIPRLEKARRREQTIEAVRRGLHELDQVRPELAGTYERSESFRRHVALPFVVCSHDQREWLLTLISSAKAFSNGTDPTCAAGTAAAGESLGGRDERTCGVRNGSEHSFDPNEGTGTL